MTQPIFTDYNPNKYVVISKALETYEASKDGRMITKQEIDSTESHLVDIVV